MTGLRTDHLRAPSRWWTVSDYPGFWFLAGAVFVGNALFSAWQHNWWLAIMQVGTAMLAVRAALVTGTSHQVGREPKLEDSLGAEPKHGGLSPDASVPPDRG
jgi:membrane protein insertase Oxa1/YidC/SpoIIIJ